MKGNCALVKMPQGAEQVGNAEGAKGPTGLQGIPTAPGPVGTLATTRSTITKAS